MSTRTTRTTKRAPRPKLTETAPVSVTAPVQPPYARGNPLTHSVTFSDSSGTCWLVYVEPAPPEPALWPNAAVLPGRRLRFDSVERSVTTSPFPAGAPFLQENTLQALLDQAHSVAGMPSHRTLTHSGPRPALVVPTADPAPEPVRQQLADVVNSHEGLTYRLSRMAQPFALVLMVIRDMILPKGRG